MAKTAKRDRLTIDLSPEEHRKIKAYAAYQGKSLKEFVVESIRIKMALDSERELDKEDWARIEKTVS